MNELQELLKYCEEHGHWLTFNYSPYDKSYQCYVNPGRSMTSAKRCKNMTDAVQGVWRALGIMRVPINVDHVNEISDTVKKLAKESNPENIVGTIGNNLIAITDEGDVAVFQKRRGRPPGSKNKPKAVAND